MTKEDIIKLAQAEPICPDCKAALLYECIGCSSNNYPPPQQDKPVGFEMAQHVAWRFKDPKDGHWLYTTHIVDLSKKYWRLKNELFDPLYTTPPAPSKR